MNDARLDEIGHLTSRIIKNVKILPLCICFIMLFPFMPLTTVYGMPSQTQISNPCLFTTAEDYSRSLIIPSKTNSTLPNNVVPAVQNKTAAFVTHLQGDKVLSMEIALNPRNQVQLEKCLGSINDPASPNYLHFLNDTTILPYVPTPGQKLSFETFLTQHGFNVTNSSSPLVLKASAPVSTIESTFGIKINVYQVPVQHKEINYTENIKTILPTFRYSGVFHAADSPPQLPSNIASLVSYIGGLDNYTIVTPLESPCSGPYCPQGIQKGYSFSNMYSSGFNGSGEKVALVDCAGDPNPQTAIDTYDAQYGLAATTLKISYPDGTPSTYDSGWASETMMDVEAVHTVAPGATIDLIYIPCSSGSLVDGIDYVATQHLASIVSNSWSFGCSSGPCSDTQLPSSLVSSTHNKITLDAAQGLTILFASGDSGATPDGTHLGTEFPASDPNVLAVGATDLTLTGCGANTCSGYGSEAGSIISGGGYSGYFAEPTWQTAALGTISGRGVPDVSMLGYNPAFWVYSTNSDKCGSSATATAGWFGCAGTSLATPLWAGYLAIIEQAKGVTSLGNMAPILYGIYKSPAYTSSFHDITSGNNHGYSAGPLWDPVTGLGSPVADSLSAAVTVNGSPCTVVATIPVGSVPYGAAFDPVNDDVYVANQNYSPAAGTVSIIDSNPSHATYNQVVGSPITVGNDPLNLAFDTANGYLYVTNSASNSVSVIDTTTNTLATVSPNPIPLSGTNSPYGITYDSANKDLYVSSGSGPPNAVLVIDGNPSNPTYNKVVATISGFGGPTGIEFDPSNGYVYVTNFITNSVSVIDGSTNTLATGFTNPIQVGTKPMAVAFDHANGYLYVVNSLSNSVSVIDTSTNTLATSFTNPIPVGTYPLSIAFNWLNGDLYVPNSGPGSVSVISGVSNTVVCTVSVGFNPQGVTSDSANGEVFVVNDGSGNVSVISPTSPVPEFGSIIGIISVLSIIGVIMISRKFNIANF